MYLLGSQLNTFSPIFIWMKTALKNKVPSFLCAEYTFFPKHYIYYFDLHTSAFHVHPCPAEPGFILFLNTVDPDQMASEEAI